MDIVDTHVHLYHEDESRYPMIETPYRPPAGIGTLEHLRRDMEGNGVQRVVLVQTGSAYLWDNRLIADTAHANRDDMVGVCNLDPVHEETVHRLERMVTQNNVRGFRMEPAKAGSPGFAHGGADRIFATARRLGIVICAHIHVQFAGELATLLDAYPEVSVVLDHSAYMTAVDVPGSERLESVLALARYKNLYPKLTFGVTGSEQTYPFRDTHAVIRQIIDVYGPERCMWGSDFPCEHWLKKATYSEHLALFTTALGLTPAEQTAILSETPMKLWFS